jgi:hypothetical protein
MTGTAQDWTAKSHKASAKLASKLNPYIGFALFVCAGLASFALSTSAQQQKDDSHEFHMTVRSTAAGSGLHGSG